MSALLQTFQSEIEELKAEKIALKRNGARGKSGCIYSQRCCRFDIMDTYEQWADCNIRFPKAFGARGHAAASWCLDQVEIVSELDGTVTMTAGRKVRGGHAAASMIDGHALRGPWQPRGGTCIISSRT